MVDNDQTEVIGNISSIETMGLVDGPGIRFVVFLQGCQMRCQYCHNPETWNLQESKMRLTPKELLKKVLRYRNYFGTEGGITFSGGEPLLQPDFLLACLKLCRENGIHTVLDTAGVGFGDYAEILHYTDLVILDIKAVDDTLYRTLTGIESKRYQQFLQACIEFQKPLWLRQVIVPSINDTPAQVQALRDFASKIPNVQKIELLPYKTMGITKYRELNISYPLEGIPDMDEMKCQELQAILD